MEKTKISEVALGLGSNLGDRLQNIYEGIRKLTDSTAVRLERISSVYESKAMGFNGPDFLNMTVVIKTHLNPFELLTHCQNIEKSLGRSFRKNRSETYQSRSIDIDILTFGNITVDHEHLKIPHPEIYKRDFVLIPLVELGILSSPIASETTETPKLQALEQNLKLNLTYTSELKCSLSLD